MIQTMTILTFLFRLYFFSFIDHSFGVGVFLQNKYWEFKRFFFHFYGKQDIPKDNISYTRESFVPCSNPLLIWIVVNGKYMTVWYSCILYEITWQYFKLWIQVRLFCQYINLAANVNQSKFCYFDLCLISTCLIVFSEDKEL